LLDPSRPYTPAHALEIAENGRLTNRGCATRPALLLQPAPGRNFVAQRSVLTLRFFETNQATTWKSRKVKRRTLRYIASISLTTNRRVSKSGKLCATTSDF